MLSSECTKQAEGWIWPKGSSMPSPDLHTWDIFPDDISVLQPVFPISGLTPDKIHK